MLYIHPLIQVLATLLGLYAFVLGLNRARSLYLGQKVLSTVRCIY